jgi:NADPH:quinone reductase-like Zn-dependent oxidoreductase
MRTVNNDTTTTTRGEPTAMPTTMTAVTQERFGAPDDVLAVREIALPTIGDDEVLVEIHAVGIAIGDWLTVGGMPYIARPSYGLLKPKRPVAGLEMAGVVKATGRSVTDLAPGDEVFGWGYSMLAEYAAVPADQLALKPGNLTFEEAAAIPISGLAALQALRDAGGIEPGQQVLIVGASGAVGTFAVQIAKALGAEVTGVASTRNLELVLRAGADHVIDYTMEGIADRGPRFDVILDMAGNRPLRDLRSALAPTGTLVIVGSSGGKWMMGFGRTIRAAFLSPFVRQQLRPFFSKPTTADLDVLRSLIESEALHPVVDRTFAIGEAPEAIRYVGERHTQGKTVVTV